MEIQQYNGGAASIFTNGGAFEHGQRIAKMLSQSELVPESYRGNMPNTLVALEMANRVGASPLMVMQNLHVIEGRPSWSSAFIIAALNTCGLFSPLRFIVTPLGKKKVSHTIWEGPKGARTKKEVQIEIDDCQWQAVCEGKDGKTLEGPAVTVSMAVAEGWYSKQGSKWQTMPDLMGRYRAAAFFGRLYAPHILMGMKSVEELQDITEDADAVLVMQAPAKSGIERKMQAVVHESKATADEDAILPEEPEQTASSEEWV